MNVLAGWAVSAESGARFPALPVAAFLFFCSLFFLFSSARANSGDATSEMDAAVWLISTGRLGAPVPPKGWASPVGGKAPFATRYMPHVRESHMYAESPSGLYYQPHDPGNLLLMAPAAWAGLAASEILGVADPARSTDLVRGAVGLNHSAFCALGCTFLLSALLNFFRPREAFALTVLFATGTVYFPYTKAAFDVGGAAVGSACLLAGFCRLLRRDAGGVVEGCLIGLGAAIIVLFRLSVAPFLALATLGALCTFRDKITPRLLIGLVVVFLPAVAFVLGYNAMRTGSPFMPALALPQFGNRLAGGSIVRGLVGITLPSRGILMHSPVIVLLALWPWARRHYPPQVNALVAAVLAGSALYTLMICRLVHWHGYASWGPRYLVPVLPLLYFPVALVLAAYWDCHRNALAALVAVSIALNVLAVVINPGLVALALGGNSWSSKKPLQHISALKGVVRSVQGHSYPDRANVYFDGMDAVTARRESLVFPNSWTVRLMREPGSRTLGITAFLSLIASVLVFGWVCYHAKPGEDSHPLA
jgi:hypothetical protein